MYFGMRTRLAAQANECTRACAPAGAHTHANERRDDAMGHQIEAGAVAREKKPRGDRAVGPRQRPRRAPQRHHLACCRILPGLGVGAPPQNAKKGPLRRGSVNGGFSIVFTSWDRDVPHQTHPPNPIHSSLARSETM